MSFFEIVSRANTVNMKAQPRLKYNICKGRSVRRMEKLHIADFHILYSSPYITRMVISRRTRSQHVAYMAEMTGSVKMLVLKELDFLGYLGVDERIILRLIGC
jgi:hypothetical protein